MSWVDEYFTQNIKDIKSFVKYKHSAASNEDAADIAHDVYLKLKAAEERIGTVDNKKSYVYTTLQLTSLNFFRGAYFRQRIDRPVLLSVFYNPVEDMSTKQVYNLALNYIQTLPEQQRKAILLKMETETPIGTAKYKDTTRKTRSDDTKAFTEAMGCSAETAKHHYYLARTKVLDFMKDLEYSFEESYVEDVHGFFEDEEEAD